MTKSIALPAIRLGFVVALALVAALLVSGIASASAHGKSRNGDTVYTLTNSASGNQVALFDRANDGSLTPDGLVDTGGLGTGGGLGSQGAVVLAGKYLLAVNAGSDSISLFSVGKGGDLELRDVEPSGGDMPISVTVDGNLVYVLNAGAPENITGFRIWDNNLVPIQGSTRPLSGSGVGPAQVEFSPGGNKLVVTEKATNKIDIYFVGWFGYAWGPVVHDSVGQTPFGFAFSDRSTIVVSEAFGGTPDASAVSSYELSRWGGDLEVVTPSAPTTETAACWIVISKNGKYAYTSNTGSGSITGYRIGHDGSLTILDADGKTGEAPAGSATIDMAVSGNGKFLHALNGGTNTITTFRINHDGSLTDLGSVDSQSTTAVGLASQ